MKELYKEPKLRPLFERREELQKEINKLMEEYKAIGDILEENRILKEKLKQKTQPDYSSWDEVSK